MGKIAIEQKISCWWTSWNRISFGTANTWCALCFSSKQWKHFYTPQIFVIIPTMKTAACLSFPTQLSLYPEVSKKKKTACTRTAFLFLITLLPLFAFHLHHHLPKWAAPKPLMIFQAQEDSLPFTPGGTDSSHWRGQAQCFSLQNSRAAWRATGYKTIPTHCPNYP